MTRTAQELRKEYEEYSRMYNNPKHWEDWLVDEIRRVENSLEKAHELAEFLTIEAGKHSKRCKELEHKIETVEPKAEAYDRLMSCGLSMKELANILKHPVAIENEDDQNELYYFDSTPYISQFSDGTQFWSCKRKWRLPRQLVNFCDIWEDSLTLPDGWEEACSKN